MRMFFIIALLLVADLALAAGGHKSVFHKWVAPVINFVVFAAGLLYVLRKKMAVFFQEKRKSVQQQMETARMKDKEAKVKLELYEEKLRNLDKEVSDIKAKSSEEEKRFEQEYAEETKKKIEKIQQDAVARVEAEKTILAQKLNNQIIDLVINKAKSTISSNQEYRQKVNKKMLDGVQL